MKNNLKKISELIKEKDNFVLVGHVGADGDSIGSTAALSRILTAINKKARAYFNRDTLAPFSFLDLSDNNFYLEMDKLKADLGSEDYILITLDSGDRDRIDLDAEIIAAAELIINIDHHADNSFFGDYNLVQADKAAVGEIIYELAEKLLPSEMTFKMAEPIATAIITDTGALRYENTSANVLRILAKLIELGVDIYKINKEIFGSISYKALILKGLALENLDRSQDGKIAWLYVSREMMHQAGTDYTEGLVGLARDVDQVEIGILFTEEEKERIKISFRSNFYAEVNNLAAEFGGGGHPRAAGATVEKDLEAVISAVVEAAEDYV